VQRFMKGSGLTIQVPVVDLMEIGAGGGSIAKVSKLGTLQVGPKFRGGTRPICYGRGGNRPLCYRRRPASGVPGRELFPGRRDEARQGGCARGVEEGIAKPWASRSYRPSGGSMISSTRPWPRPPRPTLLKRAETPRS